MRQACLQHLQQELDYFFQNKETLERALTHCSSAKAHMERLEFVGDAVLGLVIAEALHERYPQFDEGHLSRWRASLVCKAALLKVAKQWALEPLLRVGSGERDKQGHLRAHSVLANAVEAVIGAVFSDAGWEAARALVLRAWADDLANVRQIDYRDAKSRLQEWTQARSMGLPEYRLHEHEKAGKPYFKAECWVQGVLRGMGCGQRKKIAELDAAEKAWQVLTVETND